MIRVEREEERARDHDEHEENDRAGALERARSPERPERHGGPNHEPRY